MNLFQKLWATLFGPKEIPVKSAEPTVVTAPVPDSPPPADTDAEILKSLLFLLWEKPRSTWELPFEATSSEEATDTMKSYGKLFIKKGIRISCLVGETEGLFYLGVTKQYTEAFEKLRSEYNHSEPPLFAVQPSATFGAATAQGFRPHQEDGIVADYVTLQDGAQAHALGGQLMDILVANTSRKFHFMHGSTATGLALAENGEGAVFKLGDSVIAEIRCNPTANIVKATILSPDHTPSSELQVCMGHLY